MKINATTGAKTVFSSNTVPNATNPLNNPQGLAEDTDGSVLLVEAGNRQLLRLSASTGARSVVATFTESIEGVAAGSSGIFVTKTNPNPDNVYKVNPSNGALTLAASNSVGDGVLFGSFSGTTFTLGMNVGIAVVPTGSANSAPTAVTLSPASASLAENSSTSSAIELSTISITDDGSGTNTLSLSGTDAASFEIVSSKLRLKAGTLLNYESKSSYTVRVNVDDTTVGSTPDAFKDFTLTISDVNEAPTSVALSPSAVILSENANTSAAIELSTISVVDDALGTNTLSLSGSDAASFEIVAGKLRLKAGASLDFEAKSSFAVRVNVEDSSVGSNPDAFADFTLNLTNVTELSGVELQKGQSQRSFVRNIDILFDNEAGLTDLVSGNRIKLTRYDLNNLNPVAVTLPSPIVSGKQVQIDFGAQGIGGNRGTNAGDGYYEVAVDMNGDGSYESVKHFFRLYGDANGDGVVDGLDKARVLAMAGTTNVEGDVNGDGIVNASDTTAVTRAVGRKLKAGLTWMIKRVPHVYDSYPPRPDSGRGGRGVMGEALENTRSVH